MKRYKTVDDYIDGSENWQDELRTLRKILSSTELQEEVKWGAPCYTYAGKNVVGIGAFKAYLGLWFYQGALLKEDQKALINAQEGVTKALRQWRMNSAKEIRPAVIKRYVREAIQLVKDGRGIGPARKKRLALPPELKVALQQNEATNKKFSELTPGRQRDYVEYISSAKRAETKRSRVEKILPMIKSGAGLHDKYR